MATDDKLLQTLITEDSELARLVSDHRKLDQEIAKIERRRFLTDNENLARRLLKKRKLGDRDRIEAILADYKRKVYDRALDSSKAG